MNDVKPIGEVASNPCPDPRLVCCSVRVCQAEYLCDRRYQRHGHCDREQGRIFSYRSINANEVE